MWPFRKKPQPQNPTPADRRGWVTDWRIGDLAVCIDDKWSFPTGEDPRAGDVLRVVAMKEGLNTDGSSLLSGLGFEGKPGAIFWCNTCFRKATIDEGAREVEEGIISKIKRAAKQGADA